MRNNLSRKYDIFVPKDVLDEVYDPDTGKGNKQLRYIVESRSQVIPLDRGDADTRQAYAYYMKIAVDKLKLTTKPRMRKLLLPYLNGRKKISTHREQAQVNAWTGELKKIMEAEGVYAKYEDVNPAYAGGKIRHFLERHCGVTRADAHVLATALYQADTRGHAVIGEKDRDIEEAVAEIKKDKSLEVLHDSIDYVNPYELARAA